MYNTIQTYSNDHTNEIHLVASDPYHSPYWLAPSLMVLDYLSRTFPSDESIIEIMNTGEPIWEDHHHRSMFLPNTNLGSYDFASLFPTDIVNVSQSPILLQDTDSEGNRATLLR